MPLLIPTLDDRKYQQLLDEALARIPVHNPEWTNFNKSDPGVTLIEIFAFLTENLLYRSNQIPERNRRKFLSLLGIPLQPASSARGLATFANERGPLQTITLNDGLEVRAGQVPFRTEKGLDVLPIEAQAYFKREMQSPSPEVLAYYDQLYASYKGAALPSTTQLQLYETATPGANGVDLAETVDNSLWLALIVRATDKPYAEAVEAAREAIAGKTISLGLVPVLKEEDLTRQLPPGGKVNAERTELLTFEIPKIPASGGLPADRQPQYQTLAQASVPIEPIIVEITLPNASELRLWNNIDPLEPGVNKLPPALDDTTQSERVITWLRLRSDAAVQTRLLWAGINAAAVAQRAHVANELLPDGNGEPDQIVVLSKTPVIPGSVRLTVTANGKSELWEEIDDMLSAGPEVPAPDLRQPPGTPAAQNPRVNVFTVNPESGEIRFGDGTRGKRPPFGATLRADYDYSVGPAGNVGPGSINSSPALPAGLKVANPVRTWGGAEAETVSAGEKQIARYLQHRDRLVNAVDFETITWRTPGVDIGRVEVIPAYNPELAQNEPGDAPGAVTIMVIPKYDPLQPDAPLPDRLFLDTICDFLDSRRLVTTEVFLRGPKYKPIYISVGINVVAGVSTAQVREAVKQALLDFLWPLPQSPESWFDSQMTALSAPQYAAGQRGWPLRKPVVALELLAVASRVSGVLLINNVLLAEGAKTPEAQVSMTGLDLPRVMGISVTVGEPVSIDQLRGQAPPPTTAGPQFIPVPVIPQECK